MNGKNSEKKGYMRTAKECAYLSVFVALLIAVQFVFSFVPGVEFVTVLLVAYSFTFGTVRGMLSATAFSLLRQFIFGFNPTVLVLYLTYFNFLTMLFGLLGRKVYRPFIHLPWLIVVAVVCTLLFTMIDNVITPLWYGYSARATKAYFTASLLFMVPQAICTAITVGLLFVPLVQVLKLVKKNLIR